MLRSPEPSLRRLTLPLAVALSLGLAVALPQNIRLENALNRAFPQHLHPSILLVGIDDASLHDYGRIELWPRELYAAALKTLTDAGAKVIGLDVLLSDPSRDDAALSSSFSRPNVVLATDPSDPFGTFSTAWRATKGVSALNPPKALGISEFQTAYPALNTSQLAPSFARQVAAVAGTPWPLNTTPHLIPYVKPEAMQNASLSFRDVVNGNVRYGDLQNRVVVIGMTASGVSGMSVPDIDGRPVAGVYLQARAVSALLSKPFVRVPLWLTALLCALTAALVIRARQLWGFVVASLALLVSVPFWMAGIILPAVTISLAAIVATGLVAFERWWTLRKIGMQDPVSGFGNRLAFTRAVEHRWPSRHTRPFSLILVDIDELRRLNDRYGRSSTEEVMRDLSERLQKLKRRSDVVFRWGPEEFAVLLDQTSARELPDLVAFYQQQLAGMSYRDQALTPNIGAAATNSDIQTPTDLMEDASRNRYRMKYQRGQQLFDD